MKVQGKRNVVRLLGQKLILESSETTHDGQGLGTIFSSTFLSKLLVSTLTFLSKVSHSLLRPTFLSNKSCKAFLRLCFGLGVLLIRQYATLFQIHIYSCLLHCSSFQLGPGFDSLIYLINLPIFISIW